MNPKMLRGSLALLLTAGTLTAFAASTTPDVSGSWKWTTEGRDGQPRESVLTLEQKDGKVTGTATGFRGETPITEGSIEGNLLKLKVTRETQRGVFTVNYEGKVANDTITGTISMKRGEQDFTRDWVAKRADAEVVGTWAWSMEREDGQTWEASLKISKEGDKLTGFFSAGDAQWQLALQDPQVKGNQLTFNTTFERDGNSMTIKNKATVTGKTMKGVSEGSRDGETWSNEWKATRQ